MQLEVQDVGCLSNPGRVHGGAVLSYLLLCNYPSDLKQMLVIFSHKSAGWLGSAGWFFCSTYYCLGLQFIWNPRLSSAEVAWSKMSQSHSSSWCWLLAWSSAEAVNWSALSVLHVASHSMTAELWEGTVQAGKNGICSPSSVGSYNCYLFCILGQKESRQA